MQKLVVGGGQRVALGQPCDGAGESAAGHHNVLALVEHALELGSFVRGFLVVELQLGVLESPRVLARAAQWQTIVPMFRGQGRSGWKICVHPVGRLDARVRLVVDAMAERNGPRGGGGHHDGCQPAVERADAPRSNAGEPVRALQQRICRQNGDRKVRRQQVAQVFGELTAEVHQVQQRPGEQQQCLALARASACQSPGGYGGTDQPGDTKRRAHAPLHDGLHDERVRRRIGPHDHERDVDRSRADFGPIELVRNPLRVRPHAPHGRSQKGVRLSNPKGHEGADQDNAEGGHAVEELVHRRAAAAWPDEGQPEHGQQHQRADLAGTCQPSQDAGQQGVRQTLALPGTLTKEEATCGEERYIGVDGEEVSQLDVQHRQRQQQRGQVGGAHPKDAPRKEPGEDNRAQVGQARQRSADAVDRVEAGFAGPLGHDPRQRQR